MAAVPNRRSFLIRFAFAQHEIASAPLLWYFPAKGKVAETDKMNDLQRYGTGVEHSVMVEPHLRFVFSLCACIFVSLSMCVFVCLSVSVCVCVCVCMHMDSSF